jgi:hypothetical protein
MLWFRKRTNEIERHAQDDEWTSHLVLVAEIGHQDEGAASNCLYRHGQKVGFGVTESHGSDDLRPRSSARLDEASMKQDHPTYMKVEIP